MRFFNKFKDHFELTSTQASAVLALHILLVACLFCAPILSKSSKELAQYAGIIPTPQPPTALLKIKESLKQDSLFLFNPNDVTDLQMRQLGFAPESRKHLTNYRNKGGQFRYKKDLLKITKIDTAMLHKLQAFVQLPEYKTKSAKLKYKPFPKQKPKAKKWTLDLNTADAEALQKIPYIGAKRAKIIINYRKALGGYHHISQLEEVYGMDEKSIAFIHKHGRIATVKIAPISINRAEFKALLRHPYLEYEMVKTICNHREDFPFTNIAHLQSVLEWDDQKTQMARPYFSFD